MRPCGRGALVRSHVDGLRKQESYHAPTPNRLPKSQRWARISLARELIRPSAAVLSAPYGTGETAGHLPAVFVIGSLRTLLFPDLGKARLRLRAGFDKPGQLMYRHDAALSKRI
jgi:hypothetical protein